MGTVKTKKATNFPLFLGILDAAFYFLLLILASIEASDNTDANTIMVTLCLMGCISLALSFFLTKGYGAGIAMIVWGLFRGSIPAMLNMLFDIESEAFEEFLYLFRRIPSAAAWVPVLAGVLGILTVYWARKATDLPEAEKIARINKRSVFTIVTAFYAMVLLTFVVYLSESRYYMNIFSVAFYTLGDALGTFSTLFTAAGEVLEFELLEKIFTWETVFLWCIALLPSYLIYLGAHHPFSEKKSTPLCTVGIILTAITSIGAIQRYSNAGEHDDDAIWPLLLVIVSFVCMLVGYFGLCKKLPEWSYALVGCGFLVYAPAILLAVLLAIGYFILKAFGGSDSSSSSSQKKRWEITENGVTYTIEETSNGTYFDDCNREWKTDDGGSTFYRAK